MYHLDALSPVDGRYIKITAPLADLFSERALMRHRLIVEGEYFIALSEHPQIGLRTFSNDEKKLIRDLYEFSSGDALTAKYIETMTTRNLGEPTMMSRQ